MKLKTDIESLSLQITNKVMEKIILTIKDDRKKNFFLDRYDFFASAGLWKNRDITANQLREQAWKRSLY